MDEPRVPLYDRLPEIYRVRDAEQEPPGQLRSYLSHVEEAFGALEDNIAALYEDLFIETCSDWAVPYIGDLLGAGHLSGDPWTLRADVADTIPLRRRKGTLGGIERLTYDLTQWGVHCVELRENLVWQQHLNHQRPDAGGRPPLAEPGITRFTPARGGTAALRDPAMLSLLRSPFDPFAHFVDVKPPAGATPRYNLPNLAIFLWRLKDYRVPVARPVSRGVQATGAVGPGLASHVARFDLDPLGRPVRLVNVYRYNPETQPPVLTDLDATPGPIPPARLDDDSEAGNPQSYFAIDTYDPAGASPATLDLADVGLQLHLPEPAFAGQTWPGPAPAIWRVRSANLCAWQEGVRPAVRDREVLIDPVRGRVLIGLASAAEGTTLENDLLVTYTYAAAGPIGAHPVSRPVAPVIIDGQTVVTRTVEFHVDPLGLQHALDDIPLVDSPVVIEIRDSMTHDLDLGAVTGAISEAGGFNLLLKWPVVIRAASGQRPVIRLARPLRFRTLDPSAAVRLTLRLEGLFLTAGAVFPAGDPLIARAALNRLEIVGATLDPSGYHQLDGSRAPIQAAMELRDEEALAPAREIVLQRSISGPLRIDTGYQLDITDSILDSGKGPGDDPGDAFALAGATDPLHGWGPATLANGLTVYGRMRVQSINARGGIWVHALEVLNNQIGCIRYSYFAGVGDRLPQNLACVIGADARLHFTAEAFGDPGYAQIAQSSDFRIKERGPDDDAMGATGFLLEAHKWRNLQIRFREFMPVGIRPLLIPLT